MISTDQVQALFGNGGHVVETDGSKIGSIGQVFVDDETGQPEWVTVKTGLFGGSESFVPLSEGTVNGDDIAVPYSKDTVKDAPRVDDSEGHLSREQESELYQYYGMSYASTTTGVDSSGGYDESAGYSEPVADTTSGIRTDVAGQEGGVVGQDTSGPTTDRAMTRSEEQLHVGTENVVAGRARLRKYVVTENVTQTVPVSHEEVRLEREPITEATEDAARSGAELSSEEHEVTLNEERVVVNKETVPVERVKLGTETVTQDRTVDEQVAKEQIEFDDSELPSGAKHAG